MHSASHGFHQLLLQSLQALRKGSPRSSPKFILHCLQV
ncbi:hypothetical protein SLEP1_g13851 [Rubroshorea leprosula]|uniref:Uncharacterized protein n=1 Tax=Rubroshorea leprosula TaxID=152421 RepID=A0AAV5ILP1_9ROSI|nr:hypothetical protein SLEP1_g13851 [Rubroshorea leprosula]